MFFFCLTLSLLQRKCPWSLHKERPFYNSSLYNYACIFIVFQTIYICIYILFDQCLTLCLSESPMRAEIIFSSLCIPRAWHSKSWINICRINECIHSLPSFRTLRTSPMYLTPFSSLPSHTPSHNHNITSAFTPTGWMRSSCLSRSVIMWSIPACPVSSLDVLS